MTSCKLLNAIFAGYGVSIFLCCEDIDECTISRVNPCAGEEGQFCYNTQGSYACRDRVTVGDRVSGPISHVAGAGDDDRHDEPADDVNTDDDEESDVPDTPSTTPETVAATERGSRYHHHSHNRQGHQHTDRDRTGNSGLNCGTGFMYNRVTGRCEGS